MKHILVVQTYTGVNWGNHDIIFTWPVATVSSFSTKTFSFSSWKKLCWYLNWGSMLHQYLNLSVHAVCKNLNVKNNKGFYSWAGNNRSLCPNLCTTWHIMAHLKGQLPPILQFANFHLRIPVLFETNLISPKNVNHPRIRYRLDLLRWFFRNFDLL